MRSQSTLLVLACLVCLAGCNQHPPTAPVKGVVTYRGKPLTHGSIMFQPDAGPPGRSVIGPDGTFELWTFEPGDGALLGRHRVRVVSFDESEKGDAMQEETTTGGSLIPPWYGYIQSSGLEYEVVEKGEGEWNTFEIVLSDKRSGN
jgi:hypothetical protein